MSKCQICGFPTHTGGCTNEKCPTRAPWNPSATGATPLAIVAQVKQGEAERIRVACREALLTCAESLIASGYHSAADGIYLAVDRAYPDPAPSVVLTCVVCGLADKGVVPFGAPTGEPAHTDLTTCVGALGAALAATVEGR